MAWTSAPPGFGNNRWGSTDWARWQGQNKTRFRVGGPTHLQPSINTGANRTISVAAGDADCCGVFGSSDSVANIAFETNTGVSDRYDALVARFDWATRTIGFAVIKGTNSAPAVNSSASTVNEALVNRIPGVRYDGLIALARVRPNVTVFAPGDLFQDLRVWGVDGGLITSTRAGRNYIDIPMGGRIHASGLWYQQEPGGLVAETTSEGPQGLIGVGRSTFAYRVTLNNSSPHVRLEGGTPLRVTLTAGRAYRYDALIRATATAEGSCAVDARLSRANMAATVTSPHLTGITRPISILGDKSRHPMPLQTTFQVSATASYIISLWGHRIWGAGDFSFVGDTKGFMHHEIHDVGQAVAGVPTITA